MQPDSPILSVLVPAYNAEKYIRSCIKGLLAQTYQHMEVLICDDGSDDRTSAVISDFKDVRIRAFRNPSNIGKNRTCSFLLEKARGEFISIHDADDISDRRRFEHQVSFLIRNPEYAMCGTNFVGFLDNGKIIARSNLKTSDSQIRASISVESQFHGPTIVFRNTVIPEVRGLYRYFIRGEDIDFTMRVTEKFKVCNLAGHYYYYRHSRFSLTNDVLGYNLERLAHLKLLYYLAEERRMNDGIDSLMLGNVEKVDSLVEGFMKDFENDPDIALRRGVFRLIAMKMYRNALILGLGLLRRKWTLINLRCFVSSVREYVKGSYRILRIKEKVDPGF